MTAAENDQDDLLADFGDEIPNTKAPSSPSQREILEIAQSESHFKRAASFMYAAASTPLIAILLLVLANFLRRVDVFAVSAIGAAVMIILWMLLRSEARTSIPPRVYGLWGLDDDHSLNRAHRRLESAWRVSCIGVVATSVSVLLSNLLLYLQYLGVGVSSGLVTAMLLLTAILATTSFLIPSLMTYGSLYRVFEATERTLEKEISQ